jgi:hypothetical protein
MAYELISRLKKQSNFELLETLSNSVEEKRKQQNKQHNVLEISFDWKLCRNREFTLQKLNYMHNNPCNKKWQLIKTPVDYLHSSARFYFDAVHSYFNVTNFMEMEDVAFDKLKENN